MGSLEVDKWFSSGKDYAEGVALFEKLSKNKKLLKLLKNKQSDFNVKKLEYELGKFSVGKSPEKNNDLYEDEIVWEDRIENRKLLKRIDSFFKKLFSQKWKK